MRRNVAPVREPVFEAHIEIVGKDGRKVRLPLIFDKTTRPWTEFFNNLALQANTGAEAEIAEDLFAGISPIGKPHTSSESDLFGGVLPSPARAGAAEDPFGQVPQPLRDLPGLARHFLFMGA